MEHVSLQQCVCAHSQQPQMKLLSFLSHVCKPTSFIKCACKDTHTGSKWYAHAHTPNMIARRVLQPCCWWQHIPSGLPVGQSGAKCLETSGSAQSSLLSSVNFVCEGVKVNCVKGRTKKKNLRSLASRSRWLNQIERRSRKECLRVGGWRREVWMSET